MFYLILKLRNPIIFLLILLLNICTYRVKISEISFCRSGYRKDSPATPHAAKIQVRREWNEFVWSVVNTDLGALFFFLVKFFLEVKLPNWCSGIAIFFLWNPRTEDIAKMHIKSIIIEGFKSYAQRTEINGFDPLFNAITGLNGSGKSNILDSICFLLGISNLTHVSVL